MIPKVSQDQSVARKKEPNAPTKSSWSVVDKINENKPDTVTNADKARISAIFGR
jgi:hypothetical protein